MQKGTAMFRFTISTDGFGLWLLELIVEGSGSRCLNLVVDFRFEHLLEGLID